MAKDEQNGDHHLLHLLGKAGVALWQADGGRVTLNRAAAELLNLSEGGHSAAEVVSVFAPENQEGVFAALRGTEAEGGSGSFVARLSGGRQLIIRAAKEGNLVAGSLEAPCESEENFKALANLLPDAMFVLDPADNLRIRYVNAACRKTHGVEPEELIGRSILEVDTSESAAEAPERKERILSGETLEFEVEHLHRDGHAVPMRVRAFRINWQGRQAILAIDQDLTQQRISEATIRVGEERWNLAMGNSGGGLWDYNMVSGRIDYSGSWHDMLGYKPGELETNYTDVVALVHPEDLPSAEAALQAHLDGETPVFRNEHRLRTRKGTWIWTLAQGRVAGRDAQGRPTRMLGTDIDITELKRAQASVSNLSQRLALAISVTGYGVWEFDLRMGKVIWDARMCELYGVERDSFDGDMNLWRQLLHADDREAVDRTLNLLMSGTPVTNLTFRIHRRSDGALRHLEASGFLLRDQRGQPARLIGLNRDVTAQHDAESQLRLLETCIAHLSDMVLITEVPPAPGVLPRIVFANDAFTRITGIPRDEAIGQTPALLHGPRTDWQVLAQLEADLSEFRPARAELIHYRRDRSEFIAEISVTPVADAQGHVTHLVAVQRDVTDQRAAQSGQELLRAQLQRAQAMESIGRLAGGVAHDFNNMLSVILGNLEVTLDELDSEHPLRPGLDDVLEAANRSAALTRQLLGLSRQQRVPAQPVVLAAAVPELLKLLTRLVPTPIAVEWNAEEGLWPVLLHPVHLDQIVTNLLVNARDAIDGTGSIRLSAANIVLAEAIATSSGLCPAGSYVRLSVADSGCGMAEEVLTRLFQPFVTTKGERGGTGLGLATVHGIVMQLGGRIHIESEAGTGTCVHVYLPRLEASAAAEVVPTQPASRTSKKVTVLLAEDELGVLHLVEKLLLREGYQVIVATSGEEALAHLTKQRTKPTLLITDLVMASGLNGTQLASAVRSRYPDLPVLLMSGYGYPAALAAGARENSPRDAFLQKPFTAEELRLAVARLLGRVDPA
jgi:PAS domain S-box-containing protein